MLWLIFLHHILSFVPRFDNMSLIDSNSFTNLHLILPISWSCSSTTFIRKFIFLSISTMAVSTVTSAIVTYITLRCDFCPDRSEARIKLSNKLKIFFDNDPTFRRFYQLLKGCSAWWQNIDHAPRWSLLNNCGWQVSCKCRLQQKIWMQFSLVSLVCL